ncbi:MAG: DUF3806 domain-containing protein [Gammaproteobacteria bacterium]
MQSIEVFNADDTARIIQLRDWVVGHYAGAEAYESVDGKLRLIQTILDKKWIEKSEALKLQALGVSFGDALEQEVDALSWVMVDDEFGRDPALRWMDTEILAFPLTSISKRVEDGVDVDVYELFDGYKKSLEEACRDRL